MKGLMILKWLTANGYCHEYKEDKNGLMEWLNS